MLITPEQRNAAREAWIRRFSGYFGDPIRLGEYRAGTLTFQELYDSANRHAQDMTIEAKRCDSAAFDDDEAPTPEPTPKTVVAMAGFARFCAEQVRH